MYGRVKIAGSGGVCIGYTTKAQLRERVAQANKLVDSLKKKIKSLDKKLDRSDKHFREKYGAKYDDLEKKLNRQIRALSKENNQLMIAIDSKHPNMVPMDKYNTMVLASAKYVKEMKKLKSKYKSTKKKYDKYKKKYKKLKKSSSSASRSLLPMTPQKEGGSNMMLPLAAAGAGLLIFMTMGKKGKK